MSDLQPVPLSQLIESAIESAWSDTDLREICFELDAACKHVGLAIEHRFDEMEGAPVPEEISEQLWGRLASPLMEVQFAGKDWKITSIDLPAEFDGVSDIPIPIGHRPRWMSLIETDKVFSDLE